MRPCHSSSPKWNRSPILPPGCERLSTFADAIAPDSGAIRGITSEPADRFALSDVTLLTPNRQRTLIQDLTLDSGNQVQSGGRRPKRRREKLAASSHCRLVDPGPGIVKRPALAEIFFLPQRPYMLLGSLREQLIYPRMKNEITETG